MKLWSSSRTPIGVDIGRRTMKAAQLAASDGSIRALSLLPRSEPEGEIRREDVQALRDVLKRQGFKGNRIVIAASGDAVLTAALELPAKVSGAPIEQIVRMELSRLHNIEPDSFEMAYWDLGAAAGSRPTTNTLAVACPHEAADGLLDLFEEAGLHVAALDVRGAAAARACRPLVLEPPQVTAIVDLGWRSTSLLFVCGASLIYERLLDGAPLAELAAKLTEAFNISPESATQILGAVGPSATEPAGQLDRESLDAICRHMRSHFDRLLEGLKAPLSYAKHQLPGDGVKRMLLIGGGATIPDLAAYFSARLGFEVRRADPAGLVGSPPELLQKASNPAMTVAVGLAKFEGVS